MKPSSSQPHLDCLIHLGAGQCSELDKHLAREPARVVLVEADPQLAEHLERQVAGHADVQVINAAVAADTGKRTYFRYNLPAVNSLRQPTGLHSLYPGLRLLEERPVQALAIIELLDPLNLSRDQSNGLIIELAGEEASVLEALEATGRLHLFCEIELTAGRESLYEESEPAFEILHRLEACGYEISEEDTSKGLEQSRWRLRRNDLVLEISALRQRLGDVEQLAEQRLCELEEARKVNAVLTADIGELEAGLTKSIQERDNQSKVAQERAGKLADLTRSRDELSRRVGDLEELANNRLDKLDEAKKANETSKITIEQLETAVKQVTQERDDQFKLAQQHAKQVADLTHLHDEVSKRADELVRRLASAEAERSDTQIRQGLLNQEMTRAEAQIDLIKEVLLKDVGL